MIPRKQLDIGWADLLCAIGYTLLPGDRSRVQARVEAEWDADDRAVATLSVRSAVDLLLRVLDLPRGAEVLVSAVTIRDVVRILEAHGLVAVPVDLDMKTLSVDTERLEELAGPRTRAILVAHLFGSRMPLDAVAAFARRAGLLLIEDCAQAYDGPGYRGHPESDVSLFSFGPIKTRTALGGAVARFRDADLAGKVRLAQGALPAQSRTAFLARTIKYIGLKCLLLRPGFTLFAQACRLANRRHDDVISAAVRGFAGADLLTGIRRRPSYPLLALLLRRLRTFDPAPLRARASAARRVLDALPCVARPGEGAVHHTHWVVPVWVGDPDGMARHLWGRGFDVTRGASSLHVVPAPPCRPAAEAGRARAAMASTLYLPLYPGVSPGEMQRLARAIEGWGGGS